LLFGFPPVSPRRGRCGERWPFAPLGQPPDPLAASLITRERKSYGLVAHYKIPSTRCLVRKRERRTGSAVEGIAGLVTHIWVFIIPINWVYILLGSRKRFEPARALLGRCDGLKYQAGL